MNYALTSIDGSYASDQDKWKVVSRFGGALILLRSKDCVLPRFTVRYNGEETVVEIGSGNIVRGKLPVRQQKLVVAWEELHRDELMERWEAFRADLSFEPIDPLH